MTKPIDLMLYAAMALFGASWLLVLGIALFGGSAL